MGLKEIINDDDFKLIKGKYTCDEQRKSSYKEAIGIADAMNTEGLCNYKYDDPEVPFYLHCLNIRWLPKGDDEIVRVEAKRIANLMGFADEFVTDTFLPLDWQMSTTIYKEC